MSTVVHRAPAVAKELGDVRCRLCQHILPGEQSSMIAFDTAEDLQLQEVCDVHVICN